MKKSLIITIVLGVSTLIFCIINGSQINETKNNIIFTEEVLYGDVNAAKGVRFRIYNQLGSMAWLTEGSVEESLNCRTSTMSVSQMLDDKTESDSTGYYIYNTNNYSIDGTVLASCNRAEPILLVEEKNELYIYQLLNYWQGTYEKQYLCDVDSQILDVKIDNLKSIRDQNVYYEVADMLLMIDTIEEKKIFFLQRLNGQWTPIIYADLKEFEFLKQLTSYKRSDELLQTPMEANYCEIAFAYKDGKLAMLWRQNENAYNFLVLSQSGVEYASVLHTNFREELDKEYTEPIRIWFP